MQEASVVVAPPRSKDDHLVDILRGRARATPHQLAFGFFRDGSLHQDTTTYGELDRDARTIAAHLQRGGPEAARAVLLYQPGLDYIRAIFGCLYAGAVAVPVYTPRANASYERVRQAVSAARATALLSTEAVLSKLDRTEWVDLGAAGLRRVATDRLAPSEAEGWRRPALSRDTLAFLQFTSGSTGVPRGVMVQHRHIMANSAMIRDAMGCGPSSTCVLWIPPYHDMGLIGGVMQPVFTGFPMHLLSPYSFLQRPMRWLEAISRHRATHSSAPNFAYQLCAQRAKPEDLAGLDLSSWRMAANGAEPVRAETLARFAEVFAPCGYRAEATFPCYGLAEATLLVSGGPLLAGARTCRVSAEALARGRFVPCDGPPHTTLVSSGALAPGVEARIVDPVAGEPCEPGVVGEIWVRGEAVAAGYWERPEETDATFNATLPGGDGPFLRTGDLGYLHGGDLYVTGRIKDLIIIRGQNHHPHDIEATVAASHPGLRLGGTAAFSLEAADGEALAIVQEVERGHASDLAPLEAAIRNAVAGRHQLAIARLALVPPNAVPKTSSGKVRRFACRTLLTSGELALLDRRGV